LILLAVAIFIALLVTIGLPILGGVWLNKRLNVSWRVITLGSLGYFIVQALLTLLYSGFASLMGDEFTRLTDNANFITQIGLSIIAAALLGVMLRWAGMKWVKLPLTTLESAYGIGLGFGGIESITRVGLPLIMTFITMLSNININPQTSTLDPELITQLEALWQVSAWIPIAGSIERISALVMHITVTILVLQSFTRQSNLWLGAAIALEVLINGLILGFAEAGFGYGWVILIAVVLMGGNLYLLYRLKALNIDKSSSQNEIMA
jgi:uncharacterized membrane protein YhfC